MKHVKYVIVGGGISGATLLHALSQREKDVLLLERKERLGGVIRSENILGGVIERGPNTLQTGNAYLEQLIDELDLAGQLVTADPAAGKRYVLRDGKPRTVPANPRSLIETRLVSARAKLRLLREWLAKAPPKNNRDESVGAFVERHFGPEPLNYGVDPFVSGIYAGDPHRLSLRHTFPVLQELEREYGSVIKGVMRRAKERKLEGKERKKRTLFSFRKGLQSLPQAIEQRWKEKIIIGVDVKPLERNEEGWRVVAVREGGIEAIRAENVILALDGRGTAEIVGPIDAMLSEQLGKIEYASIAVVSLLYDRSAVAHSLDGFGLLVPSAEKRDILGVIFSSTIFPSHASEGKALLTVFIGGVRRPELVDLSQEELIQLAHHETADVLSIGSGSIEAEVTNWRMAIPQYNVGYDEILAGIEAAEERNPGLYLLGSYRNGVSIPDCVKNGYLLAKRLKEDRK